MAQAPVLTRPRRNNHADLPHRNYQNTFYHHGRQIHLILAQAPHRRAQKRRDSSLFGASIHYIARPPESKLVNQSLRLRKLAFFATPRSTYVATTPG